LVFEAIVALGHCAIGTGHIQIIEVSVEDGPTALLSKHTTRLFPRIAPKLSLDTTAQSAVATGLLFQISGFIGVGGVFN
jgi:hypothetical protein